MIRLLFAEKTKRPFQAYYALEQSIDKLESLEMIQNHFDKFVAHTIQKENSDFVLKSLDKYIPKYNGQILGAIQKTMQNLSTTQRDAYIPFVKVLVRLTGGHASGSRNNILSDLKTLTGLVFNACNSVMVQRYASDIGSALILNISTVDKNTFDQSIKALVKLAKEGTTTEKQTNIIEECASYRNTRGTGTVPVYL